MVIRVLSAVRAAVARQDVRASHRRLTPTIYDVARAAGVAPSTVSRTFSRPGRVNPETADHVRAIAKSIGYRGRAPRHPHEYDNLPMIGVLVADSTDPVAAEFVCGAESAAAEANYTMLLSRCQVMEHGETESLDQIFGGVQGIVVANPRIPESVIDAIGDRWPLVVLDRTASGLPSVADEPFTGGASRCRAPGLSRAIRTSSLCRRPGEVVGRLDALARAAERGRRLESQRPPRRTGHSNLQWRLACGGAS